MNSLKSIVRSILSEKDENNIINQRSNVNWTPYLATGVAEGFESVDTEYGEIEAWAYLIATGKAWRLQGFFWKKCYQYNQYGSC